MGELSTEDVIEKYFNYSHTLYPIIPDMQRDVSGEMFLRYQKSAGIELYIGTDDGEVLICKTRSGEKLERIILSLIS